MTEEQTKQFEEQLQESLKTAYHRGFAMGCKVVNQMVLEKIRQYKNKPDLAMRIVTKFCSTNITPPNIGVVLDAESEVKNDE